MCPKSSRATDAALCRVLLATLVGAAVAFTITLTGVFVDIDGLLAKHTSPTVEQKPEVNPNKEPATTFKDLPSVQSNENEVSENVESDFRIKRSIESNSLLYHIKSPKIKKILTNHLATLLEELEEEELSHAGNTELVKIKLKPKAQMNTEDAEQKTENTQNMKEVNDDTMRSEENNKDVLHVAMHNILLQGIMSHMDLNEVYKHVHQLIKSFDGKADDDVKAVQQGNKGKPVEVMKIISQKLYGEEDKFFDELLKCKELQKEIAQKEDLEKREDNETTGDPPMIIKTVIEITNNKNIKETITSKKKAIQGIIKLLYNGNPVQFDVMNDNKQKNVDDNYYENAKEKQHGLDNIDVGVKTTNTEVKNVKNSVLNQAIAEYIRIHTNKLTNNNLLNNKSFQTKRLKRQTKINYKHSDSTTVKSGGLKRILKKDDDELFVEIETHFDGKGAEGDRKKKLVRNLIDKIQKALNSNVEDSRKDNNSGHARPTQIRKRSQKPIDNDKISIANSLPSAEIVEHRQHNFISKTINVIRPLTSVLDIYGDTSKKIYNSPGFLTVSKSLNSAELGKLDYDYMSMMKTGIPKRLQNPINAENDDMSHLNEIIDTGNAKLYLKEIGGSGFTIGINQYIDEPPDQESLKMFSGLENLIQAYHENYDQRDVASNESRGEMNYVLENNGQVVGSDAQRYKRGVLHVKLFPNLKSKTKLSKLINTNAMQTRKIFYKRKRNKRHIDKIRIVATDHYPRDSKEKTFLASRESLSANRAVIKEDIPEIEIDDREDEYSDYVARYKDPTYGYDAPHMQPYMTNVYDNNFLRPGLMSKYPHVFLENISKSKEEIINMNSFNPSERGLSKKHEQRRIGSKSAVATEQDVEDLNESNMTLPNVDEIINAVLPPQSKYKLTVKILPKNSTKVGPGYKEVHTSINKSYDKNGVRYISYINFSEISKIENVNNSKENIIPKTEKSVKDEKEKLSSEIKIILKLYKLEQQLEHLKRESQILKQMINKEDKGHNVSHIIDVFKQLQLKNVDERNTIFSLIDPRLGGAHDTSTFKPSLPITKATITITPTPVQHEDAAKLELINTIKLNENITRNVLQKIDQNTNMLQSFLQKLSDKLQSAPQEDKGISRVTKDGSKYPDDAAIHPFIVHRNSTNPIPFVYAFQPPIGNNKKTPFKNVATVLYHGHIHANGADDDNKYSFKNIANTLKTQNDNDKEGIKNNESRFFIDELDNEFKAVPDAGKTPTLTATIKTNTKAG